MKKAYIFFGIVAAVCLYGFVANEKYTIKGNIKGAAEGTTVYLRYADIPTSTFLDSTNIKNGSFEFKGKLDSPRFLSVIVKNEKQPRNNTGLNFFAENASITVTAAYDSLLREYELSGGATVVSAKVQGSKSHDSYLKYYNRKSVLDKQRSALFSNIYIPYLNPGKGKEKGPKEIGIDVCRKMDSVADARKNYVVNYVLKNKPTELLSFIATQGVDLSNVSVAEIKQLTAHFSGLKSKGTLLENFYKKSALAEKTAIGSALLDFTLNDTLGNPHKLSEYVGKGRYVLLEFWASWCGPCRADIPHLKEAFDAYNPRGFDVVSISLDDKKDAWLKAVNDENLGGKWPQLADLQAFKGDLAREYRINGIPSCLLFDPSGKLVTRNMRGSWMDLILINQYGDHFAKK